MVGCSLCRLLVLHIKCVPHPPTPLHSTFPVCVYCNTLDRHGASCRHIRHNHNAASDSSCVPPILIPLTPLQPQPTKPSPIAVFVLATTVISPVCPLPPPHFFYPVAICIPRQLATALQSYRCGAGGFRCHSANASHPATWQDIIPTHIR